MIKILTVSVTMYLSFELLFRLGSVMRVIFRVHNYGIIAKHVKQTC